MACIIDALKEKVAKIGLDKGEVEKLHFGLNNLKDTVQASVTIDIKAYNPNGTELDQKYSSLSNLNVDFNVKIPYDGKQFNSVEHAFQYAKAKYAKDKESMRKLANPTKAIAKPGSKVREWMGTGAQFIGQQVTGLNVEGWNAISEGILEDIMKARFQVDKKAAALLVESGNMTLTHKGFDNKYETVFPRILTDIRKELQGKKPSKPKQQSTTGKFTLTKRVKWTPKDQLKADRANAYIGYGIGSTGEYKKNAENAGILTNENIDISKDTIAYVSFNGKGRPNLEENRLKTAKLAKKVLEAGGTILVDRRDHAMHPHNKVGEGWFRLNLEKNYGDKIEVVSSTETVVIDGKKYGYDAIRFKPTLKEEKDTIRDMFEEGC